jgi:hypothetical protein
MRRNKFLSALKKPFSKLKGGNLPADVITIPAPPAIICRIEEDWYEVK